MKITSFFLFTLLLLSISLSQNPGGLDEETKQRILGSVEACIKDVGNCDCSSIKYATIRADCQQRSRLMKTCLEYRDCALAGNASECSGIESCYNLTKMPLVPEVTPGFLKPLIEPIVLKNVCPMMAKWPYDKGNYRRCGS